jgi:predicted metalloprotease
MKWERGHKSEHVEDRRGKRVKRAAIGGGAAIVAVLAAVIGQALGVDLSGLVGGGGGGGKGETEEVPIDPADQPLVDFFHYALDDIQETFDKKFRDKGRRYEIATLVLFTDATDTGCGLGEAAIGPFYCPPDKKAYIDVSFFKVLEQKLGAGGDFAAAYVLAHEIGHHIQKITGIDEKVRREEQGMDKADKNALSVRQELQADCYAGVWAHSSGKRGLIEAGDIEEAVRAAEAIGDDRLQKMAGQKVNKETWTHGSSAQRVRWFRRGQSSGDLDDCDTFSAGDL